MNQHSTLNVQSAGQQEREQAVTRETKSRGNVQNGVENCMMTVESSGNSFKAFSNAAALPLGLVQRARVRGSVNLARHE